MRNRKWSERKQYIRDVMENGEVLDQVTEEVEVFFQMVDEGIGPYECHGVRGNQQVWVAEVVKVEDVNGNNITEQIREDVILEWQNQADTRED